ncbi:MAG: RNA polymerase sigma factor [Dysgonomonas sp.]|jgi:RNA polymerase sigma-70 factor (ECF subfamily)|uniref:RNA polymerase sigma factor n=1 Tax=unclassified Dysgonomonas TaxID=2630389 RepID=UPI0025C49E7C|nr:MULTISPECIES: sigma-70 family RNA polymerase sigma factor [unclassified Dysgonomonas]MDR2002254.1 sigma-70 family RNA polymerase sigma factor [Prevotella sp.]HMM03334.1 sigma-70 family RNA polymerase sigma factor [Dysgonomonas sp.]
MNELQIIAGCKEQKREAQKMLYEAYARKMYSICLRYSSDQDAAQDLLQDGFMKVFANIDSFQDRGSFEGWLKRVFINLALENLRKKKSIIQTSDDVQNLPDVVDDSTEDEQMYKISEDELLKMVQDLPRGYSTVFNLYAIEDYSHKEIAEMMGINEGTSRSQYVRARNILQEKVKQYIKERS